jgi:aminopeptidase N
MTNQGSVAGANGGVFIDAGDVPSAPFAHETAHAWTKGSGPGANFIREGWATFCEALVLRDRFGPEVEQRFWDQQADRYFRNFDGKHRIDDDLLNSGVAYPKGGWIFAMLERVLGAERFNEAMARFAAESQKQSKTAEEFMAFTGQAAFLSPWIAGSTAPVLSTRIDGKRVTIEQSGVLFDLPLEIEIKTATSVSRRRVQFSARSTVVEADQEIVSVILDPRRELLLRR